MTNMYRAKSTCVITLKKNMIEDNISQKFRRKKIAETRNYFIVETNQNNFVGKKYKKRLVNFELY